MPMKHDIEESERICATVPEGVWGCPEHTEPSVWVDISEDRPGICSGKRKLFGIDPYDYEDHVEVDDMDDDELVELAAEDEARAVAVFIAHARTALPLANAEMRELRAENERLRKVLQDDLLEDGKLGVQIENLKAENERLREVIRNAARKHMDADLLSERHQPVETIAAQDRAIEAYKRDEAQRAEAEAQAYRNGLAAAGLTGEVLDTAIEACWLLRDTVRTEFEDARRALEKLRAGRNT